MLLREQVPIRQLGVILETLGDYAPRTKDPIWLTEYVRHRLARTLCTRYRDSDNRLFVVTLDPALEERIAAGLEHNERGLFIRMSPQAVETTCRADRGRSGQAHAGPSPADRAGQPADPAGPEATDCRQPAEPARAELQRNDARHADRVRRNCQ